MKDLTDPVKCHRGGKPWKNQHPTPCPLPPGKRPKTRKTRPSNLAVEPEIKTRNASQGQTRKPPRLAPRSPPRRHRRSGKNACRSMTCACVVRV